MPRSVKAHLLVMRFDGDEAKTAQLRQRMIGAALVRRDEHGQAIVDSVLRGDKGKPPAEIQPPAPTPRAPRDPAVELARLEAELEAEIKP